MRTVFIENLQQGQLVSEVWAITQCEEKTDKNGGSYLFFELTDRTGVLRAHYFKPKFGEFQAASAMDFALICGTKNDYGLNLTQFPQAVPPPDDLSLFMPVSPIPLPELDRRFDALAAQITEPRLSALLQKLLGPTAKARAAFWNAPAAMKNHHAFRHGLLHHSIEVAEFCGVLWDKNPGTATHPFQRDLLLTGALLHDIGKLHELSGESGTRGGIQLTTAGHLLGHTALGLMGVRMTIDKLIASPLRDLLLHLIASHHGKLEFGAPVVPLTRESLILHKADALSAELFYADRALLTHHASAGMNGDFVPVRQLSGQQFFVGDYGFTPSPKEISPVALIVEKTWRVACPWREGDFLPVTDNNFAVVRLPLLARVAAGPGIYAEADVKEHYPVCAWAKDVSEMTHYLLSVSGDSMTGAGISDNDLIVVQFAQQADHGDIVVATLPDGAVTVKRFETGGAHGPVLQADSVETAYPSPFVPGGTAFCLQGVVRGVLKPA